MLTVSSMIRRTKKQGSRAHLLKLSAALVALSIMLIFYGQFLLHTRCDEAGCAVEDEGRGVKVIQDDNDEEDGSRDSALLQRRDEEPVLAQRKKSDRHREIVIDEVRIFGNLNLWSGWSPVDCNCETQEPQDSNQHDDITSVRRQHKKKAFKEEDEEVPTDAVGWRSLFPALSPDSPSPPRQTSRLVEWLRSLSDPAAPAGRVDPAPLGGSGRQPREYLFACARDEFNISDSLVASSEVGGNINGKG